MGVHGLWELLAPVGRRVSVETLAGKKLAIDASIWMIQFMKAMRDEKGEMVRNAHILGFFRRICKLLYLRTKPVFVFDGGTPALKRRTVIARRRQRENAQAKIRKTAEKLLLNHLKAMRLKELAADLEKQRQENDVKGKRPSTQDASNEQETQRGNSVSQEELDEMLAASIAAEEDEDFGIGASTSGAAAPGTEVAEEEEDDDEEMILPEMHGKVDPAVLAALPPSMQLDLLVQMRERLMAENRQKYQQVKKAPERFSELQIEAYLKTVAFRREIDGVQKAAAGRGIGGVQTSRIASEANREFIFSSSFTGDKEALTSVGQERNRADQSQAPPVDSSTNAVNKVQGTKKSGTAEGPTVTETGKAFNDDVETYVDERGRLRVSRVRALGIRMTRDLQRNLDLMKESDQKKAENHQKKDNDSSTARNLVSFLDNSSGRMQHREASNNNNDGTHNEFDKTEEPELVNGAPIEISFEDMLEHGGYGDNDDKLFASLVAGDPVMDFSVDNSATAEESLLSASDDEWEEGFQDIQLKSSPCRDESQKNITKGALEEDAAFQEAIRRSLEESRESMNDFHENHTSERARETVTNEDEVEWEEEFHEIQLKLSCPDESQKTVAKGTLEEEAAFQEAIRRSLEDTGGSMNDFHENHALEKAGETVCNDEEVEWEEGFQEIQLKFSLPDESQKTVARGTVEEEAAFQEAVRRSLENTRGSMDDSQHYYTSERAREEMVGGVSVCEGREQPDVETLANEVRQQTGSMCNLGTIISQANSDKSHLELKSLNQDAGESGAFSGEIHLSSDAVPGGKGFCMNKCQTSDTCSEDGNGLAVNKLGDTHCEKVSHESSTSVFTNSLHEKFDSGSADAQTMFQAEFGNHFCDPEKLGKTSADDSVTNVYGSKHVTNENLDGNSSCAKDYVTRSDNKEQEIMEDDLEEVMMFLDKEREELGSEQRKLERNAESVNNEMFVECQELLQMFGLPYIIAPMEAEAQCAFLELSNQVDGVVTDDSDAFLFGAQSVYKNIFDDRKYVETYLMKDIENELGLDREKLIHMALLLGSDYTEGISGIGIVNAIEVVNAFPGRDGLREFRDWIESPDPSILGKLDVGVNSRKKGSKGTENIMTDLNSNVEGISCDLPVDDDERKRQIFKDKHRNVSKNWHISSSFPSDAVISAYASPQVDKSTEPFSWGKPDLFVLRKLCWEKFAWGASKADELLLPVLKEYNKHETQLRMEAFYTFNERFAKIRSKRIEKAVKGITGSKSSDLTKEAPQQSRSGRKRKATSCKDEGYQSGSTGLDGAGTSDQSNTVKKPTGKQSKRGRMNKRNSQSNLDLEHSTCVDEHVIARKESHVKGRNRRRGRGQQSGRGKRKNKSSYPDPEIKDGDTSCSEHEEEMLHVSEEALQARRSGRSRKTVNYNVSDESDNSEKESATFVQGECLVVQKVGVTDESNKNQPNVDGGVEIHNAPLVEETVQSTHGTDKMSTSMINGGQMDDPSDKGLAPDEYLQFGGGFCLDEDEEKESSPAGEKVPEKSDVLDHLSDDEQNMNDSENHSMKFLRAMPNLRRKRRKN